MRRTEALQGVRMIKFRSVLDRYEASELNQIDAAELLGGTDRPDTANRAINAFKRRSGMPSFDTWMVWDYLTDPDAWMVEGDVQDTELRFYNREPFNTVHDIDFDSRSVKTAGWTRYSSGNNGWYGVAGVPSS